jgi:uncharacterized protein (TIGR02145 family)
MGKHFSVNWGIQGSWLLCLILLCVGPSISVLAQAYHPLEKGNPCRAENRPRDLHIQYFSDTTMELRWESMPNTSSYWIQAFYVEDTSLVFDTLVSEASLPIGKMDGGRFVEWSVRANCADGSFTPRAIKDTFFVPLAVWNCGDYFVDMRDGVYYPTVRIGSQCWCAKSAYLDLGEESFGYSVGDECTAPSKVGAYYNWTAAKDIDSVYTEVSYPSHSEQGVCPAGWHIPTNAEFELLMSDTSITLEDLLIGGKTGFNMNLGGYMNTWGNFVHDDEAAIFLTSNEGNHARMRAWFADNYFTFTFEPGQITKICRGSVRCLKDNEEDQDDETEPQMRQ